MLKQHMLKLNMQKLIQISQLLKLNDAKPIFAKATFAKTKLAKAESAKAECAKAKCAESFS